MVYAVHFEGRERKMLLIITTASPCTKIGSIERLNLQKKKKIHKGTLTLATLLDLRNMGRDASCY